MLAVTTRQRVVADAGQWPAVADVARLDLDELRELCDRGIRVARRDEFEDVGRALTHTARLLWGERVTEPIRRNTLTHRRQVLVLAVALDQLLHPDKRKSPRRGSEQYTDLARRRLARWYWAATFAGYKVEDTATVREEAKALYEWARGLGPFPRVVTEVRAPDEAEIRCIRFAPHAWKHRAIVTLLARLNPRDLLTGELLDVDRRFDATIHGHHLFPRAWAKRRGGDDLFAEVDSVANVAALTGYTNAWLRDDAPEDYIARIRRLGVPQDRIREILKTHLVDPDLFRSDSWDRFYENRVNSIHRLVRQILTEPI